MIQAIMIAIFVFFVFSSIHDSVSGSDQFHDQSKGKDRELCSSLDRSTFLLTCLLFLFPTVMSSNFLGKQHASPTGTVLVMTHLLPVT